MSAAEAQRRTQGPQRPDAAVTLAAIDHLALARARRKLDADPSLGDLPPEPTAAEEISRARAETRWTVFRRQVPGEYTESRYSRLTAAQDPRCRVTGWWTSGSKSLLLAGAPGRGKTDAAYAIANEVAELDRARVIPATRVMSARLIDLRQLNQPLADHERHDTGLTKAREVRKEALRTCELLLLDDVTSVSVTDSFREFLHGLIDSRTTNPACRTIFTCNADSQGDLGPRLTNVLGAPIVSRMRQGSTAVWVEGPDMRESAVWDPFA